MVLHYCLSSQNLAKDIKLILVISSIGAVLDSLLAILGVFTFSKAYLLLAPQSIPLWLYLLWLAFAMTLARSLSWFVVRGWLFLVLAIVGGPLSYIAGRKLGAVSFEDSGIILLVVEWFIIGLLAQWLIKPEIVKQYWRKVKQLLGTKQHLLGLTLTLLTANLALANHTLVFQGKAYDPSSGQLLYTEKYQMQVDKKGHYLNASVQYVNPKGKLFATKQVDYSLSLTAPSIYFRDLRNDHSVEVKYNSPQLWLKYFNKQQERSVRLTTDPDEKVVIDAGFDQFVQQHWQQLLEGRTLSFEFLAISRAKLIGFKITQVAQKKDRAILQIYPRNFFLGLVLRPIELTYQISTKRLLEYNGLTNIAKVVNGKVQDDNYVARIEYSYS
jgi:hypothetical protein